MLLLLSLFLEVRGQTAAGLVVWQVGPATAEPSAREQGKRTQEHTREADHQRRQKPGRGRWAKAVGGEELTGPLSFLSAGAVGSLGHTCPGPRDVDAQEEGHVYCVRTQPGDGWVSRPTYAKQLHMRPPDPGPPVGVE